MDHDNRHGVCGGVQLVRPQQGIFETRSATGLPVQPDAEKHVEAFCEQLREIDRQRLALSLAVDAASTSSSEVAGAMSGPLYRAVNFRYGQTDGFSPDDIETDGFRATKISRELEAQAEALLEAGDDEEAVEFFADSLAALITGEATRHEMDGIHCYYIASLYVSYQSTRFGAKDEQVNAHWSSVLDIARENGLSLGVSQGLTTVAGPLSG
jgi:hypothetical protein